MPQGGSLGPTIYQKEKNEKNLKLQNFCHFDNYSLNLFSKTQKCICLLSYEPNDATIEQELKILECA